MEVDLVLSALRMAREARQPAPGVIVHVIAGVNTRRPRIARSWRRTACWRA
jgi:hypothetical protein